MKKFGIIVIFCLMVGLSACTKEDSSKIIDNSEQSVTLVFYGAGYNNLASDILNNMNTLAESPLPFKGSKKHLLVYSHLTSKSSDYITPTESYLVEYSLLADGTVQKDTLLTLDEEALSTDPAVMQKVLLAAKELAPADHYGMMYSSHGTGWLPAGYYESGDNIFLTRIKPMSVQNTTCLGAEENPLTKAVGVECSGQRGNVSGVWMELADIKAGIPFKLDYLVFDACLMGGVEVVYELKDVAEKIVVSPAEILTKGFDYTVVTETLLGDSPSPEALSQAYYDFYETGGGRSYYHSSSFATITCVNTDGLENLADACNELFEKYREEISSVSRYYIQTYFSGDHHWFYDLYDILNKSGVSSDDLQALQDALDGCISYKAATESYIGGDIKTYSGLSMYLPNAGSESLDDYYRELAWNKATSLVE